MYRGRAEELEVWVVSAAEVLIKIARCLFPLAN